MRGYTARAMFTFRHFSLVFPLLIIAACTSETGTTDGSSGGTSGSSGSTPTITSSACSSRCQTKMTSCEAPANAVSQGCGQLCGNSITDAQMTCFEGKSCEDIAKAETFNSLCPNTGGSSGSSGSSGGETCTQGKTTCNSAGDSTVKCATTSGGNPYTLIEKCSEGKCKDGQCGHCTSKSDCRGIHLCKCKDGQNVAVTLPYDCISSQCQHTANPDCGSACSSHGGAE